MKTINIGSKEVIHFIGIGGIGMSGLAQIMKVMGFKIQGSDINTNRNIDNCKNLKIKVYIGHKKHNLNKAIEGIESAIKTIQSEKTSLTTELSNELLTEYESLRARPGYVGVAKLVNRTCNGCHLDLPAVEVDRIKKLPEDNIINCEECGCILVR